MTNLTLLIKAALEVDPAIKTVTEVAQGESARSGLLIETTDDRVFSVILREVTRPAL